jgi:phytoene dehydrogenase-like protein
VRQYLNAPEGAVCGFAPSPQRSIWHRPNRSPRTVVSGHYLASAHAGFGGYTGVGAIRRRLRRHDLARESAS